MKAMISFLFRKEQNQRRARHAVQLEKILRHDPGELGDIEYNKRVAEKIRLSALRRNR
jgi:hypothetical protein